MTPSIVQYIGYNSSFDHLNVVRIYLLSPVDLLGPMNREALHLIGIMGSFKS